MTLFEEYRWRGMLQDATEGAEAAFNEGTVQSAYVGFDPTGASLHVGHLLPVMGLVHLQRAGHRPIAVVGGGTGLIGDPSGKSAERNLLSRDEVQANAESIRAQLEPFLDFGAGPTSARMVNNLEWLGGLSALDFLRDVGKHFSVNVMLQKDTIRRRLDSESVGISYTEFSYLLLQSYDFLRLFQDHGCRFQFGGQDQWGNITAGIDLIRRVAGEKAWGVTFPLITTASGVKFGKTEAGAVWLDPGRTSPYRFYQFWLNTDDQDVGSYLRYFTLLSRTEVEALDEEIRDRPHAREAQLRLATEVTRTLHGESGLARAETASRILFGGEVEGIGADEAADIFADVPSSSVSRGRLEGEGMALLELLAESGIVSSRGEARRALDQGGVYLNNRRAADSQAQVTLADTLEERFLLLRKGKKNYHLIRVEGPTAG